MSEINQTFKVGFNTNSSFKVKLDKTNSPMAVDFNKSESSFNAPVDKSDNSIYAKSDVNNSPEPDTWYDEIIYYDGGGVEGYGD
jgi:hypothetical protein